MKLQSVLDVDVSKCAVSGVEIQGFIIWQIRLVWKMGWWVN